MDFGAARKQGEQAQMFSVDIDIAVATSSV